VPVTGLRTDPSCITPCAQHRSQQSQDALVADAFLNRQHQLLMGNRLETTGDVRLDHPPPAPPGLIDPDLQGVVHRTPGTEPKGAVQHVGLEDRLSTILAAACTMRSRTVGIDSGRRSLLPYVSG